MRSQSACQPGLRSPAGVTVGWRSSSKVAPSRGRWVGTGCWQDAPPFLVLWTPHRAAWGSWRDGWRLPERVIRESTAEVFQVRRHHLCVLFSGQHYSLWKGTDYTCDRRGRGDIGCCGEGCLLCMCILVHCHDRVCTVCIFLFTYRKYFPCRLVSFIFWWL